MDFSSCDAILQARGVFFVLFIYRECPGLRTRKSIRNTKNSLFLKILDFFHPFERKHTAERLFKFVIFVIFGVPSLEILKNP